jgi:chaperone BCS1
VYGIELQDGVWDGRALRGSGPTFDALLQCVGGIATCDGVLLFVTTNHPDRIDRALKRGGRLDVAVEFLTPDIEGRRKIARRILGDGSDVDAVLSAMPEASAADLQERLSELALQQRFGDAA